MAIDIPSAVALGADSVRVVKPIEVGDSIEVWMSTRSAKDQHLVVGESDDDHLDIRLSAEVREVL